MATLDTELVVRQRYADAAQQQEAALCCPVDYDAKYLKVIPQEVIDRDYGCGDPSQHVREGETVLDLGSGGGKICFIASQVVGPNGRVIGVDMNDAMLELARTSQAAVAEKIGYSNVKFLKGKIQDMAVDRDAVDEYLSKHPVTDEASLRDLESFLARMRSDQPMIEDDSVDVVVSNCVLNLVDADEKELLFDEIFRVLRPGGRAVISDIVCDQEVPEHLQANAELWSGCISGAYELSAFLEAFEEAGLVDVSLVSLQHEPWQVVEGIAFRSATVIAYKSNLADVDDESANDFDQSISPEAHGDFGGVGRVYRGPFKYAMDDEGRMYTRGMRCEGPLAEAAAREAIAGHFAVFGDSAAECCEGNSTSTSENKNAATQPSPTMLPVSGDCCSGGDCC